MMPFINTLNDIDFEIRSGCTFKALVECSYGHNGVSYRGDDMGLLKDESSPEARVKEA